MTQGEKEYVAGKRISKDNRVLFTGPRAKLIELIDLGLAHAPMFMYRLYEVTMYRILPFSWKYLTTKNYVNTTVTDAVIFDALTNCSLLTMTKIDASGEKLSCQLPSDFVCTTMRDGFCPAGLEIVMDIKEKKLEKADIKDKRLCNEQVLASIAVATSTWAHTQIHLAAEKCAREITKKPSLLKEIKESGRYTVALHDGLLFGPISPAAVGAPPTILSLGLNQEEFFEYAQKEKLPHDLDRRKMQFRYFNFLFKARKVTFELVKKHQIAINPEYVFNNVVLHSVDHYSYSDILKYVDFPFGGCDLRGYCNAIVFIWLWTMPIGSFFRNECISTSNKPFYKELYSKCAVIDKDYADHMFYSTSF